MADDAVLAAIEALNARLDRIEAKLDHDAVDWALDGLGNVRERAPVITDALASLTAVAVDTAQEAGIDPVETGVWALETAKKAAGPRARGLVDRALDDETLELLEKAVANPELLRLALTAGEAFQEAFAGKDIAALTHKAARLAALLEAPEMDVILDSGALGSDGLTVAGAGANALVEARKEAGPVGPIGALFKLGDPDVKKAVGFALALAKRFGSRL